ESPFCRPMPGSNETKATSSAKGTLAGAETAGSVATDSSTATGAEDAIKIGGTDTSSMTEEVAMTVSAGCASVGKTPVVVVVGLAEATVETPSLPSPGDQTVVC